MKVIMFFLVLTLMCSGVFALSGVSPSSYEVDFEPGYSEEFIFNFILGDRSADLYVGGDLAKYVSLNKRSVSGSEKVIASLNLPSEIDNPGINNIEIIADGVKAFIQVNVPYPSRYVEIGLNAPNANIGNNVSFELELIGKGNESVVVSPRIEVFKEGEQFDVIELEDVEVSPYSKDIVNVSFGTDDYTVGDYLAVAYLDYDNRTVRTENPFRLGEFSVGLVDYTKEFRDNKIEKFEVSVESLCDDDIKEVYAEVNILGFPDASFITSVEDLPAWRSEVLFGFLDTSLVDKNNIDAEIVLYYDNETRSEIVELKIADGFDYVLPIVLLIFAIGLALLFWKIVVFIKNFNKHKIKKKIGVHA